MNKTTEVFESKNSNYSSTSVERALKLAEEALNAMLTHMGMDEDEWTKPTFNQAREALAVIRAARAEQQTERTQDAERNVVGLAEQAEQESVAIADGTFNHYCPLGTPLYAAPQPVKQKPALKVGNLVTINQDPYPALGKLFVQLWDGDDLIARVYANDEETLNKRVAVLNASHVRTKDLTDDEIEDLYFEGFNPDNMSLAHGFARAVIAADREKNK